MKLSTLSALLSAFILLSSISCKESKPHFTIKGKISNADSTVLYLEKRGLDHTVSIDSIKLDADGNYSLRGDVPEYGGEFYVMKLNNQVINIAVDSIEEIIINADKQTFATKYTVQGSNDCQKMQEVTLAQYELANTFRQLMSKYKAREITAEVFSQQTNQAIGNYKVVAQKVILSDYSGMAAYYALFQKVDGLLIFDILEKSDLRLFQSTATSWKYKRPDSSRAKQLEQFVLQALANIRSRENSENRLQKMTQNNVINAQEYYNIMLPDKLGKSISLFSFKGKPILLDFTSYDTEFSPEHNIQLNKLYNKYGDKLIIYQVSLDSDDHIWRNVASNLPWTTVRDAKSIASELLTKFNIQYLPTIFLIDKKGDISRRVLASDNIDTEIKKIL